MKKKLLSFLALFISLSIYFSCTDEGVEVSGLQRINPDSDLLAYAMNLVGENGEGCSLIDFQKGNSNSRAVTDYSTVATPLWDKAKTEQHGDEEVLIVPLQGEDDIHSSMYFEEEEMGRLYQTKTFSKLVVRNKNGHTVTQVFTYLPGRNYAKNRQAVLDTMGFSPLAIKYYGTILISDLTGKFQQGFYYERGIPTIHLTPKKHTHTAGSRAINDSTECDHHEHSHSMDIRLRLSGNMRIASRNINEGEEVDFPCMFCGQSALTCSCFTVEGNYIYCDDCGKLKGQCVCLPTMTACGVCGMYYCICFEPCEECGSYPCVCDELIGGGNNSGGDNLGGGGSSGGSSGNNSDIDENPNLSDEFTQKLKRIGEYLKLVGIDINDYKIKDWNGEFCISNAKLLPDGTIVLCEGSSYYSEMDQASMIWHEIFHYKNGHFDTFNYTVLSQEDYIDLRKVIPEEILCDFNTFFDSKYSGINEFSKDMLKSEFLTVTCLYDKQWYKNEINAYSAELKNNMPKSAAYNAELRFQLWYINYIFSKIKL